MATSSRRKPAPVRKGSGRDKAPEPPRAVLPAVAEPSAPPDEHQQAELFDRAVELFQKGGYGAARSLFERAALGPIPAMAHIAQLHSAMCARRVAAQEPSLATAEEHYDYAIALINEGRFPEAERHLAEAVARVPDADHVHYALALCVGLGGDIRGACRHLRRAIELQPRNRSAARNDPDFTAIAQLSPLLELLYPERAASASPRF